MTWLDSFNEALKQNDFETISKLIQNLPDFQTIEDMRIAYLYLAKAKKIFEDTQVIIRTKMNALH